ncbi:MAG: arylesterase [Sterolibacteriaceae bacterium]|uniref:arylesterase n=1 Tax=Sulfuritalea sp. TaxID=2480090 RepID=UPI001A4980B5|nr:arylesterase [Sulfuritalea sp.]MBL8480092.1 arylesterase [Sterolibacteriaceae bacterium]MBN8477138.1 arylesterase [Sulfuritalea sp.]
MSPLAAWLRVALAALLLALAACGGKPKESPLPAGTKVLALGDSLTAPHGVRPGEDWPTLLGQRTGWAVINGGISGDTSAGALERLPALLDEHQPKLVLVTLGGNDMLRKLPPGQTVANLGRMLDLVGSRGAKAVLLATPKPSIAGAVFNNLAPAEFYAEVAKDKNVPLIKDALPEVLSDTALKGDQLHPNAAGHARLDEKIHAELRKIGFAR